jgi:demethylmenaquinone methyltransferase / 2-methoxy-6-polyprenyl-1,4-benzoquinol methylase
VLLDQDDSPRGGRMDLPAPAEKAVVVRRMFGAIAPRYDLLNHLLSLNRDRAWRRRAVDLLMAERSAAGIYLDACAGTLDLAVELADRPGFQGIVVATDFTLEMLERGTPKAVSRPVSRVCADTLRLPLPDATCDAAMVGFGVRNLASLEAGLAELARVLRPGGRLAILEFTTPRWRPFRALYLFYFRRVLPWIGSLISRHGSAYSYLPESVLAFPEPATLGRLLEEAGFRSVRWERRTGGIVAIHIAERMEGNATSSTGATQSTATIS